MLLEEFADCCGAVLLHDLYMFEAYLPDGSWNVNIDGYRKDLENNITNARKARYGLIVAITNPEQENVTAELQHAGFKLCLGSKNPLHGTLLKLWALDLNEDKPQCEPVENPFETRQTLGVTIQGQNPERAYPGEDDYYPDLEP